MAKQHVNTGTVANDGTGDNNRDAFNKINDNFDEIYVGIASVARKTAPPTLVGESGDVAGMIAISSTSIYGCHTDYDGATEIWTELSDLAAIESIISITESQISDLQNYALSNHTHVATSIPSSLQGQLGDEKGNFAANGTSLYYCYESWDDGAIISASDLVPGTDYAILSLGDCPTDFTFVGSPNNNIGQIFTATGPTGGDGTVREAVDIWAEIANGTITAHIADSDIHFTREDIFTSVPTLPHGAPGDLEGMMAKDSSYLYVCIANYVDNATVIWKRIQLPTPTSPTVW